MSKRQKDFIIRLVAYLIFLATTFLSNDRYILRDIGYIIFFIAIAKDGIKDVFSKRNKKNITILVIAFLIFCVTMILPDDMILTKIVGIFIFIGAIFKENIKDSVQRFRMKDDKY